MDISHLLLLALFLLTIAHLVTLKVCSLAIDHRTAPLFISGWTLMGLAAATPIYGHLWGEGYSAFLDQPVLLALTLLKAVLLYFLFIISQQLMQVSLSSRHYVTPLSVGLIAILNSFLGETLTLGQWCAALGLCGLAAAFFFKGHLAEMDRSARLAYGKLVGISVAIAVIDQIVLKQTNWFAYQVIFNVVLLVIALLMNMRNLAVIKTAFLHRAAALAGLSYMATELVKFYQMVSINPITVIIVVQAMTKPVILALSAVVWKERTIREQLIWGVLAFIVTLPLFL
jgi:hypothetical protein